LADGREGFGSLVFFFLSSRVSRRSAGAFSLFVVASHQKWRLSAACCCAIATANESSSVCRHRRHGIEGNKQQYKSPVRLHAPFKAKKLGLYAQLPAAVLFRVNENCRDFPS